MSSEVLNCVPDGEEFMPSAEELEQYYEMLAEGKIPELDWKCPGRRPPSPEGGSGKEEEEQLASDTTEAQEPLKNDFDFSDDVALPQMRVRTPNTTPKSQKKKIANFAGVMEVLKKKNAEGTT